MTTPAERPERVHRSVRVSSLRNGDEYKGPELLYRPERAVGDNLGRAVVAVTGALTRFTRRARPPILYRPDITRSSGSEAIPRDSYTNFLQEVEGSLEPIIPFSEFAPTGENDFLNPIYPRSQILLAALFASAIEDTTLAGLMTSSVELITNPQRVNELTEPLAEGGTQRSPFDRMVASYATLYKDAQDASRQRVAQARLSDSNSYNRYVALDALQGILPMTTDRRRHYGGELINTSAYDRERLATETIFRSTTGEMLRRIFSDIRTISDGGHQRERPDSPDHIYHYFDRTVYPPLLIDQVEASYAGLTGREREVAFFELAHGYLRESILSNAHKLMNFKLMQLETALNVFEHFAERLEPTVIDDRIVWRQPKYPPHKQERFQWGTPHQIRSHPTSTVNTACPARRPFTNSDAEQQMNAVFGNTIPGQFKRSPADVGLHLATEAARAYILYTFNTNPHIQDIGSLL